MHTIIRRHDGLDVIPAIGRAKSAPLVIPLMEVDDELRAERLGQNHGIASNCVLGTAGVDGTAKGK